MVSTEFARHALGAPPDAPIYSGSYVQTVAQVADMVAAIIEHPVAELFTNPSSEDMARRYFADVGAFESQGANPWAASRGSS
jgi:hypothetical protein